MRALRIIVGFGVMVMFAGCAGQPVEWNKAGVMDLTIGGKVAVTATCEIPTSDLAFLQSDIQQKVKEVLKGNGNAPDSYKIDITITKYDEGSAFARFMLAGLGQMYLYGTVEIKQGDPPVVIREGYFKKNYAGGGIVGGSATMQSNVLPKVGKAIAAAIKSQQTK